MNQDRSAIEDLLTRLARFADKGDGNGLSLLFLTTGVLTLNSKAAVGRQAIAEFINDRNADPDRKTRHTWSNLLVEKSDDRTMQTSAIQITFEQQGSNPASLRVSDLADAFEKNLEGIWRFASRTVTRQIVVG